MTRHLLHIAVFLAGLAVVAWVGAGYAGTNAQALAVIVLIGACYLAGGVELHRYRRATGSLSDALDDLPGPADGLQGWLGGLHPTLRQATRLRIEGERAAMPGPALTPYLVGLLVLLGMLGTFLGMVATLRGTGVALQGATDLQAIRSALAAPVQGLGFAFGTSVAGVAASAMLGLLAALCRRERIEAAQRLDGAIAAGLRSHSRAHQRDEAFRLMQRQAEAMPVLADRLEAMMAAMIEQSTRLNDRMAEQSTRVNDRMAEQTTLLNDRMAGQAQAITARLAEQAEVFNTRMAEQTEALNERLASGQDVHHGKIDAAYTRLAASVEQVLTNSAAESARAAGAAIQPAVAATLEGLARETAAWRESVAQSVQQQLAALAENFQRTASEAAERFQSTAADVAGRLQSSSEQAAQRLQAASAEVAQQFQSSSADVAERWHDALAAHHKTSAALTEEIGRTLDRHASAFETRSAGLVEGITASLQAAAGQSAQAWDQALSRHEAASGKLAGDTREALAAATAGLTEQAAALVRRVDQSHAEHQAQWAAQETERLAAWTATLEAMTAALRDEREQGEVRAAARQQAITDMLAQAAEELSSRSQAHARETITEVSRLVEAAAEAPKAAAQVIGELREQLSQSMARDNDMLAERNRLLETLATLLDGINHASTEQRTAVEALVAASADMLERVGERFTGQVEADSGKLAAVAAQVSDGAAGVANLGEAFGAAVERFGESNTRLMDGLARIEAALDKAGTRSDEQLAYYVAQAREVVELSVMSQKQILDAMQEMAERPSAAQGAA